MELASGDLITNLSSFADCPRVQSTKKIQFLVKRFDYILGGDIFKINLLLNAFINRYIL